MSDRDDDRLMDQLRAVAGQVEPVPPDVVAAAQASLTWRTVDDELAELAFDSRLDTGALAGTRSATMVGPRLLTFSAGERHVELEVTEIGRDRRLVGQLVPGQPGSIEVRAGVGTMRVEADEVGR